jgi:tetratricopeptide (TPR) repeat protein
MLVLSLLTSGCGGAHSRYEQHLRRSQEYLAGGDYVKATVEIRNAMQIEPKNPGARLLAAKIATGAGKLRDAVGLYQSVVESNPENVEARANLGRLLDFGGQPDTALTLIAPAIAKFPDDPELLIVRASAELLLDKRTEATADADHALAAAPNNEDAIGLRAGLYRKAGDLDGESALLSASVRRLPDSVNLRMMLADLYVARDKVNDAETQLFEVVRLRPLDFQYRVQLAVFYTRSHQLDKAQKLLEAGVSALPKSDEAKLTLVSFLATQRSPEIGEKRLRDFIDRDPDNSALRLGLGAFMLANGNRGAAETAYRDIIKRDSKGPSALVARNRLASMMASEGRVDEASKLVDEVLAANARDNDALALRADLALRRTEPAAAVEDLRAVLRDQPQAVGVRKVLAQAYSMNDEPALAEQTLRDGLDLAPTDVTLRISLAQLLAATNRADQAVTMLEKSVHDVPDDPALREALARAYFAEGNFKNAESEARDLQTLQPKAAVGFYLAGLAARADRRLDDAQRDFERALTLQPKALDSLSELAHLELSRGNLERAIALVNGASVSDDGAAFRLNLLGELYVAKKDYPRAVDAFQQATHAGPKWWPAFRNLAIAQQLSHDPRAAIETYETALKLAPREPQLVAELAQLYATQGRPDEAIRKCEAFIKEAPSNRRIANNLAMMLVTYRSDLQSLDRARDLAAPFSSSDDGGLLDTNGWVHFKRAEYAEALPVLKRAVARAPESREIRYHLAMVELRMGQSDRALSDLKAALAGSPTFAGVNEARSTLAKLKDSSG